MPGDEQVVCTDVAFEAPVDMVASSELPLARGGLVQSQTRKYFRRMMLFRQMDFEYALWQMLYLCAAPSRVFDH